MSVLGFFFFFLVSVWRERRVKSKWEESREGRGMVTPHYYSTITPALTLNFSDGG